MIRIMLPFRILLVKLSKREFHIASPLIFYSTGFEAVFNLHIHKDYSICFYCNIGNRNIMFFKGHFVDFFSRW